MWPGSTLTRVTTDAYHGVACLKAACTGINQGAAVALASAPAVTVGLSYSGQMRLKAVAGLALGCTLSWYTAGDVYISTSYIYWTTTGGWDRPMLSDVAPATAAKVSLSVYIRTATACDLYLDCAMVEQKAQPSAWIVGGGARSSTWEPYSGATA